MAIPDSLAALAWELEPVPPHERPHLLRESAPFVVDRVLARVARGRGALDVALGEGLDAMGQCKRELRLGFSGLGDYARERLGLAPKTARAMARLSRELRLRPLLRAAVRSGELSARKAQELLPVALGEEEAGWVARARSATVRELRAAVSAARGGAAPEEDEAWERIWVGLNPSEREIVGCALDFAGRLLGPTAPTWERLEALFQETLSALPVEEVENEKSVVDRRAVSSWVAQWQESLEKQTDRWAALDRVEDHATPEVDLSGDPFLLDEQLRALMAARNGWDATLGHLAMLMKMCGFWRDLGFSSFGHYCAERLGLATRTVEQRVALERKLHSFPSLRRALREGRVSYEKARIVADCARERNLEKWLARAEQCTCIELRRAAEAAKDAQMCSRNLLEVNVPVGVTALLNAACRAVHAAAGRRLTPGQCLVSMSLHFIKVWAPQMCGRSTPQRRARERDGGLCQVPGCSRPGPDAHHIILRSRGGGEAQENLVGLCKVHHLQGVHAGYVMVEGEAPDRLIWELGVRPGLPPLWVVQTRAPPLQ